MFRFLLAVWAASACFAGHPVNAQTPVLDANLVSNTHADQVGIWINTTTDKDDPDYRDAIVSLKLRSLRYGWQFGVVDKKFDAPLIQTPRDPQLAQGLVNENKRYDERFFPRDVASILDDLSGKQREASGFFIAAIDGVRYRGDADTKISQLAPDVRIHAYSRKAAWWARWARENRFRYFEMGVGTDQAGFGDQASVIEPWSGTIYAKTVRQLLTDIKRFHPEALCGINGGLRPKADSNLWFEEFVQADPQLAQDLDFFVAQQDESWVDAKLWSDNAHWQFGRIDKDLRRQHRQWFGNLPIQVTKLSAWNLGENPFHYRSLLMLEMLGNIRMDRHVEHSIVWPSRWGKAGGVFKAKSNQLSAMGWGLAAYTRFAGPQAFGHQTVGSIRLFATKSDQFLTVWAVNHAKEQSPLRLEIRNAELESEVAQVWQLRSNRNSLLATDTVLEKANRQAVDVQLGESAGQPFSLSFEVLPVSATIIQLPLK